MVSGCRQMEGFDTPEISFEIAQLHTLSGVSHEGSIKQPALKRMFIKNGPPPPPTERIERK